MADAVKLQVEARDPAKNKGTGTRVSRRLRAKGQIPAIVYGHKLTPTPISVPRGAVLDMIKKATHLAELNINGNVEMALIRDVQWDHLGKEILHLDFARVSAEESIETEISLEMRGYVPGATAGGVLEVLAHSVPVVCRAGSIPDAIKVDVGQLQVGQGIHVRDLVLPEGVTVNVDPDTLLVHVVARAVVAEPTAVAAVAAEGGTQPEVIKPERKEKEKE